MGGVPNHCGIACQEWGPHGEEVRGGAKPLQRCARLSYGSGLLEAAEDGHDVVVTLSQNGYG